MSGRVVVVAGGRGREAAGLERAEAQLLAAVRRSRDEELDVRLRIVGGRGARRRARELGGRWLPARPGTAPRRAWRRAELVHLAGLDLPPPEAVPFLATCHDLAALAYPDEGALPPWAPRIAERAALLVCPSRFTAAELAGRLGVEPTRIRVVPNGPGWDVSAATPTLDPAERATLGLPDRYVLRLGGYTRRKNVARLLAAWARVASAGDVELVLAGPPQPARDAILAAAPSLDRVRVLDYLPAGQVARAIRSADAVVTTSLYEGFGMTPLEAMAAGTPVVAVRTPAAEEVCGEAALLVGDDSEELAAALEHVLADAELRGRLAGAGVERAARFTWDRAAALLRGVYRECLLR